VYKTLDIKQYLVKANRQPPGREYIVMVLRILCNTVFIIVYYIHTTPVSNAPSPVKEKPTTHTTRTTPQTTTRTTPPPPPPPSLNNDRRWCNEGAYHLPVPGPSLTKPVVAAARVPHHPHSLSQPSLMLPHDFLLLLLRPPWWERPPNPFPAMDESRSGTSCPASARIRESSRAFFES